MMVYVALSIFFIQSLTSLTVAQSSTCDANPQFNSYQATIEGVQTCAFKVNLDKFNADCVLARLPELKNQSLCPTTSNGLINGINMEKVLKLVNELLKQPTVCGVPLNPILMVPNIVLKTGDLITEALTSGKCTLPGNNGFITNLNQTVLSMSSDKIIVNVNRLTYSGIINCNFNVLNYGYSTGDMNYDNPLSFVVELSLKNGRTVFNGKYHNVEFYSRFTPRYGPFINGVVGNLLNTFNRLFQSITQKSDVPIYVGNFLSSLINAVFEKISETQC